MYTLGYMNDMWVQAAEAIVNGHVIRVDVGKCTSVSKGVHYFFNEVGWGLAADSNETAESLRCCGTLRYDVGGLVQVLKGKRRHAKFNVDGMEFEGDYSLLLASINQHAGVAMKFCPYAKLNDGMLDVVIFLDKGRCNTLKAFDELKKGIHIYNENMLYFRFKTLTLETASNDLLNVDGENCSLTPATFECMERVLPMFYAPEKYESLSVSEIANSNQA